MKRFCKKYLRENETSLSPEFLMKVAPPKSLTASIIAKDKERVSSRTQVHFDKELIEKILDLRVSPNVLDNLAYLQFVSGRRISEIFDGEVKSMARKNNKVKMKLSKKTDDAFYPVQIMSDLTANDFRKELLSARKKITGMKLDDLTSRLNKRMKSIIRKDLSTHSLRGLYANWMWLTENPQDQNLVGYVSDILGHSAQSDSGVNYSMYTFDEED